jgi:predicted DNA-binding WGR domain protein
MPLVHLELIDPRDNRLKDYQIDLDRDFLGDFVVIRRWGRIGTDGQETREGYATETEAHAAIRKLCTEKLNKGYRVVSDPAGLAPPEKQAETWHATMLRNAAELETLAAKLPAADSRFARITAALASACRSRRDTQGHAPPPMDHRADWALEVPDERIREKVFKILDELVSGVLDDSETALIARTIQNSAQTIRDPRVTRLVPKIRHAALNHALIDIFAADETLAATVEDFEKRGFIFVGDLVQAPYEAVLRVIKGDRAALANIEIRLRDFGLRLGSAAPLWRRPPTHSRKMA